MNPSSMQIVKHTPKILFNINVTVLRGKSLPNTHTISGAAYYVVIKVDDTELKTTVSIKGDKSPSWGKQFKFAVTSSSTLRCKVFCAHPGSYKEEDHVVCSTRGVLQIGENLYNNEDIVCDLDVVHPKSSLEKDRTIILQLRVDSLAFPSSTGDVIMSHGTPAKIPTPGPEFQMIGERWKRMLVSLQSFCLVVKDITEIDTKARVAVAAVSVVLKIISDQIARDSKIGDLACTLAELFDWLQDGGSSVKIRSFEKTVKKLLNQTSECAYFVRKYYETGFFLRRAVVNIVSEVDATITQYQSVFDQLRIELILGTSLQTSLHSVQIFEKVTNIEIKTYLNDFPCLEQTAFDPDHAAMRGTHCDPAIDEILNWVAGAGDNENTTQRVFFLLGPAGSGKSSIAHFVAQHFYEEGRLGCGIFLHGGIGNRNSQRISGTMIRQLAQFHPAIKQRMSGPISDAGVAQADIGRQFKELIVTPLEKLEMVGPVLVIIDDLDVCGNARDRSRILSIFADESLMTRLPPNFRFLITSRPKRDIQNTLNHVCYHTLPDLEETGNLIKITLDDPQVVRSPAFYEYGIDRMRWEFLRRAGGDVIWTSVACRALQVASTQAPLNGFVDILFWTPLPMTLQDSITQLLTSIFQALSSGFSTPPSWVFRPLLFLGTDHVLTNEMHCIDHTPYVEWSLCGVAEACLDRMNESLRHNKCRLPTTFHLDIETNGLTRLIEKHIPKDLQYAVANWMAHILEIQNLTDTLMKKLHELLFEHLLHWIEVLSLIGHLNEAKLCASLQLLDEHIFSQDEDGSHSELCRMIKDMVKFLQLNGSTISQAHLHTYISALPLFPYDTLLYQTYIGEVVDERPRVSSNIVHPLFSVKRHNNYVRSVAFSPSSYHLVSCGDDQVVRVSNRTTGEEVHLMQGHSDWVISAVFSPDGQRVASCGNDKTIRIWNIQTGQLYIELTGHNQWVWCVEFSRDGSKLVSRSENCIITWMSDIGEVIGEQQIKPGYPFATFSPDGQQLATTSSYKTEIWDFKLEHQIAVLGGHKNHVQRVAWSLDGSYLASSSKTETLLWDTKQKSLIAVLDARTYIIKSLRFTASQLSLVTNFSGLVLLHTWDINTPNYDRVTKIIARQPVSCADVRFDLGRVVAGTEDGDIIMWDIDSPPTLSAKDIDNQLQTDTITFHEPFHAFRFARHVDSAGCLCTQDGQKIFRVSGHRPCHTIKHSIGKLQFLDHRGRTRLEMESSSIR